MIQLNYTWVLGNTKRHCPICYSLAGTTRSLAEWENTILPGFHRGCNCSLQSTLDQNKILANEIHSLINSLRNQALGGGASRPSPHTGLGPSSRDLDSPLDGRPRPGAPVGTAAPQPTQPQSTRSTSGAQSAPVVGTSRPSPGGERQASAPQPTPPPPARSPEVIQAPQPPKAAPLNPSPPPAMPAKVAGNNYLRMI